MSQAWVLVNTVMGKEHQALDAIKKNPSVKEAYVVMGVYDILVFIEADSLKQLDDVLRWNIRRHKDICNTVTMLVM